MTYKADWSTGDILTAAQQNSLAEQAVSRFADASARNAAITSPTEGQACWLNDTNEFQIYDGSSWKPLLDTDTFSVSSGNYTISTDLTVSGDVTIQTLDMDTIVEGDVIYGSGADTLARLAKGSDDEVLTLASGVPSWAAASGGGASWSGSTANGIATYGDASTIVAESTATYDGTTLTLTQSGGGLKMDGLNSSDANTLDDYEEGYFTAAATVASGTLTVDTAADRLKYTKIGQVVHIYGLLPAFSTATTPSGSWYITGLPFTNTNTQDEHEGDCRALGIGTIINTVSDVDPGTPFGWIEKNDTRIKWALSGIAADFTMNANYLDTGSGVAVFGSYTTDS